MDAIYAARPTAPSAHTSFPYCTQSIEDQGRSTSRRKPSTFTTNQNLLGNARWQEAVKDNGTVPQMQDAQQQPFMNDFDAITIWSQTFFHPSNAFTAHTGLLQVIMPLLYALN